MTAFLSPARLPLPRPLLLAVLLACATVSNSAAEPALDLERFRGKVVLVDFWASWCAPCRQSFPWLNDMQAKYGPRGLVVIGVNVDRDRADAERFLRDTPAEFQILFDPEGALAAQYDLPGMPSSFVFAPDGALAERHIGFRQGARADREAELVRLLASAAPPPRHKDSQTFKGEIQ